MTRVKLNVVYIKMGTVKSNGKSTQNEKKSLIKEWDINSNGKTKAGEKNPPVTKHMAGSLCFSDIFTTGSTPLTSFVPQKKCENQ